MARLRPTSASRKKKEQAEYVTTTCAVDSGLFTQGANTSPTLYLGIGLDKVGNLLQVRLLKRMALNKLLRHNKRVLALVVLQLEAAAVQLHGKGVVGLDGVIDLAWRKQQNKAT